MAPTVVEACLAAGCHYIDTTGEQDWVLLRAGETGATNSRRRACCSRPVSRRCTRPARSRPTSASKRRASIRSTSWCCGRDFPTYASTQTIFTILKANWYYLEQNKYVAVGADGQLSRSSFPASTRLRSPCRGAELRIRSGSRTIRACPTCKAARRRASQRDVMEGVVATQKMVEEQIKPLPPDAAGSRAGRDRGIGAGDHAAS